MAQLGLGTGNAVGVTMPSDDRYGQVLIFSRDGSAAPTPGSSEDQNSPALNLLVVASLVATSWGVIAFVSWAMI